MRKLFEYETKRVLPRIEAILSVEEDRRGELRGWIRQSKFNDDIERFSDISNAATMKLNAQWTKAILAALPDTFWSVSQEGLAQLDKTGSAASLRLLSTVWEGAEQEKSILHQKVRKEVMQDLLNRIPVADRRAYKDMLHWVDSQEGESGTSCGETRFGLRLNSLERMMDSMVAHQDLLWRKKTRLDDAQTTPVAIREEFSTIALRKMCHFIDQCCAYGNDHLTVPDSLLALLSAHMSCNKAVLEYAAMNNRGREAQEMTVSFLRALNLLGIQEVPVAFDALSPESCERAIFTTMQTWFGYQGSFIQSGTFFAKHMTHSDIRAIVKLSRELQEAYIVSRGSNLMLPKEQAQQSHGGSQNRFIFALVLAAAFYSKMRTDREFAVGKNASYAVFPDRQSIKRGDSLSVHARDVLLKAYGLVFFGNQGWDLLAEGIEQYAEGTEVRRLHNQAMLLYAVKGRTAKALMGLYDCLTQLPFEPDRVFTRIGMKA